MLACLQLAKTKRKKQKKNYLLYTYKHIPDGDAVSLCLSYVTYAFVYDDRKNTAAV